MKGSVVSLQAEYSRTGQSGSPSPRLIRLIRQDTRTGLTLLPRKKKELNDTPARWKSIQKKYGLTRDDYKKILAEQNGVCFICQRSPEKIRPRRNLAVEHDHKTGRIRGLCCYRCNHVLLHRILGEDIEVLKRALKYLTRRTSYGKVPDGVH